MKLIKTTLYVKIENAEFSCPSWFPVGAKSLIYRILDPIPETVFQRFGFKIHPSVITASSMAAALPNSNHTYEATSSKRKSGDFAFLYNHWQHILDNFRTKG